MSKNPANIKILIHELNTLLDALHIPAALESPTELAPPLLLAVLEGVLCTRFHLDSLHTTPVQQIKAFLGILEIDVLDLDVGLTAMDPRRLADCEWEEVVFVAELLCWIGRRHGIIPKQGAISTVQRVQEHTDLSPLMSTSSKDTHATAISFAYGQAESVTSLDPAEILAPQKNSRPLSSSHIQSQCIREISSPLVMSPDLDCLLTTFDVVKGVGTSSSDAAQNVRFTGCISPVDEEMELSAFQSNQSLSSVHLELQPRTSVSVLQALEDSRAHTLFLKQRRARLLAELAQYKATGHHFEPTPHEIYEGIFSLHDVDAVAL